MFAESVGNDSPDGETISESVVNESISGEYLLKVSAMILSVENVCRKYQQ